MYVVENAKQMCRVTYLLPKSKGTIEGKMPLEMARNSLTEEEQKKLEARDPVLKTYITEHPRCPEVLVKRTMKVELI